MKQIFPISDNGPFRAKVDERFHKLNEDCPADGWVTGYLIRDLHGGEILPHIFNCPCTWVVLEETIEPVGFLIAQWIKVEDRLPEPNTRCIIRTIHDDYIPGVYLDTGETNKYCFWGFNERFYYNITHWMPIVPPKED